MQSSEYNAKDFMISTLKPLRSSGTVALLGTFLLLFILSSVHGQRPTRRVTVTFDDLPATGPASTLKRVSGINRKLLEVLRKQEIPATGFVNESKLMVEGEVEARTALLDEWLEDGHMLGNHTYSHIGIDGSTFEQYRDDLILGEKITKKLLESRGMKLTYFRHPQLRTGPTKEYAMRLSELLSSRGYTVAPVTIDNNEYIFAAIYADALRREDRSEMKRISEAYVEYMAAVFSHFEALSRGFLGYELPQILLLHANELNADHFDDLVTMIRRRGYKFVTLAEALKDKAYGRPEATSRRGLSWIHRWMLAEGCEIREEPDVPSWVQQEFSNRR